MLATIQGQTLVISGLTPLELSTLATLLDARGGGKIETALAYHIQQQAQVQLATAKNTVVAFTANATLDELSAVASTIAVQTAGAQTILTTP